MQQSLTFDDEPQIFFLKVIIDTLKMSMTFLVFAFFCTSIAPRNHHLTLEIITPNLRITPQHICLIFSHLMICLFY